MNICSRRLPRTSIASDISKLKLTYHWMCFYNITLSSNIPGWLKSQWRPWICYWWHAMRKHWISSWNPFCEWCKNCLRTPIQIYKYWPLIRLYASPISKKTHHHTIVATISLYRNFHRCAMATMRILSCGTAYVWRVFVACKVSYVKQCLTIWLRTFGKSSTWRK